MKRKKKIIFIAAFILIAIIFFLYCRKIKNQRAAEIFSTVNVKSENLEIQSSGNNDAAKGDQSQSNEDSQTSGIKEAPKISVTPADCDDQCSKFKKDNELEYCEQVCGISDLYDYPDETNSNASQTDKKNNTTNEENSSPGCEQQQGIEKDYCLKDQAIAEEDFKMCEEIKDENIKKTCKNRITESLLEEQKNSGL